MRTALLDDDGGARIRDAASAIAEIGSGPSKRSGNVTSGDAASSPSRRARELVKPVEVGADPHARACRRRRPCLARARRNDLSPGAFTRPRAGNDGDGELGWATRIICATGPIAIARKGPSPRARIASCQTTDLGLQRRRHREPGVRDTGSARSSRDGTRSRSSLEPGCGGVSHADSREPRADGYDCTRSEHC